MKVTQSLSLTGLKAQQIRDLIAKLRDPRANSFWKVLPYCADYLKNSPFPNNRLIFFCPTYQGEVCVIELPTDDPSQTTMFNIMNRPVADGRWCITRSPKAERSEQIVRRELGLLQQLPDIERITVPQYECYPFDVNINGARRQGLQVHGVTSTSRCRAERRLDPLEGGSFCSVCENRPVAVTGGQYITHGTSKGCAFVSAIDRLNDVKSDKGMLAALHVAGCSNTFFNYKDNSNATPLEIFNFEKDDPMFGPVYHGELLRSKKDLSLIDVFEWYTRLVISVYEQN